MSLSSTLREDVIPFPQNKCIDVEILPYMCSFVVSESLVFTQCEFNHTRIETKTIETNQ